MNLCHRLRRKPATFRQFTGLTVAEFDKLRDDLESVLAARKAKARAERPRRRQPGAGRKPKLGPDDRLLLVLMYYRVYVTQVVLGGLFGVDAGTACRAIREVGLALAGVFRIPERKVRLGADELAEAFVDATEQPTHRPKHRQRRYYSGKKKRHTIKHQVVVVRKKKRPGRGGPRARKVRIAAVSEAAPGSTHDKRVYDRSRLELPAGVPGAGDTASLGTRLRVPREAPRAALDPSAEGRESAAGAAAGGGGARDREDEGVADRGRPVPEPATPAHAGDEERCRTTQPDVRVTGPRPTPWEGSHRPAAIAQRVYCPEPSSGGPFPATACRTEATPVSA